MKLPFLFVAAPLFAFSASAVTPTIEPGTCRYLVGAPAGGILAGDDESFDGGSVDARCDTPIITGTRADGAHSAQLHFQPSGIPTAVETCAGRSWIGNEFAVGGVGRATAARIDVAGGIQGSLWRNLLQLDGRLTVRLQLDELDPLTSAAERLRSVTVFELQLQSELEIDQPFNQRLDFQASPGREYRVTLILEMSKPGGTWIVDLGPPGTGRGAWYDSIEVCVDAPPDDSALIARIADLERADLELRLYNKECPPRVWMPAAQGGRIEDARQLLSERIAQAVATGDPNVNARVATARLTAADADIAAGQYQRACRGLSEGLRALTTP